MEEIKFEDLKKLSPEGRKRFFEIQERKKKLPNMPFVDPLTDWGFKRLFGSDFNKEVLIGFTCQFMSRKEYC